MKFAKLLTISVFCQLMAFSHIYANEEASNTPSKTQLGLALLTQQRFEEAIKTLDAAFAEGDADAGFYLARIFETGQGVQPNVQLSLRFLATAAEQNSALAKHRLGMLYYQGGAGLLQDFDQAHKLICQAGDANLALAAFNCAQLYTVEQSSGKNIEKALEYFQLAIDNGHSPAMVALALIYDSGDLVEKNTQKAHELLMQAADLKHPHGLFHMAVSSELGTFVEQNTNDAHMYYNLATAHGHPTARQEMERLNKTMSGDELRQAQKAALDWTIERSGISNQDDDQ